MTHSTATHEIGCFLAPGFEGVVEAFERNFAERDELRAAFSAVRDGETVVRVGFSYAMNVLRDDEDQEGRAETLLRALHEAVA